MIVLKILLIYLVAGILFAILWVFMGIATEKYNQFSEQTSMAKKLRISLVVWVLWLVLVLMAIFDSEARDDVGEQLRCLWRMIRRESIT